MARIRNALAAELGPILPEGFVLIDSPESIGTIDPKARAVVQLVRTKFAPAPADPLGHLVNDFDVWLIEPTGHVDHDSEDRLDDLADDLTEALMGQATWAEFVSAERSKYDDKWAAYRFTLTIASERK